MFINVQVTKEEWEMVLESRKTISGENDFVIHEKHAEIILRDRKGKEKSRTKVSLNRVEELMKYNWYASGSAYVSGKFGSDEITLHRFIMKAKSNEMVDHVNGDKFDNRDENLRIATRSQNMMNTAVPSNNKSGFKGVNLDKRSGRWRAYITINKKQISLGYFETFESAVEARTKANEMYQGDFAYGKGVIM